MRAVEGARVNRRVPLVFDLDLFGWIGVVIDHHPVRRHIPVARLKRHPSTTILASTASVEFWNAAITRNLYWPDDRISMAFVQGPVVTGSTISLNASRDRAVSIMTM